MIFFIGSFTWVCFIFVKDLFSLLKLSDRGTFFNKSAASFHLIAFLIVNAFIFIFSFLFLSFPPFFSPFPFPSFLSLPLPPLSGLLLLPSAGLLRRRGRGGGEGEEGKGGGGFMRVYKRPVERYKMIVNPDGCPILLKFCACVQASCSNVQNSNPCEMRLHSYLCTL